MSSPRIALVSGANDGIGLEIAKQLAGQGFKVYVGARTAEKGKAAVYVINYIHQFHCYLFFNIEKKLMQQEIQKQSLFNLK